MTQTATPAATDTNTQPAYHCSKCGYNLHGVPLGGTCPECGQSAKTRISAADYLRNDASRKFWTSKSLLLIQFALALDLVMGLLKTALLAAGQLFVAAVMAGWMQGTWLVLLGAGAYGLFYGITRINRKGYAVLARSTLLYLVASMFVLLALQEGTLLRALIGWPELAGILLREHLPPSLMFLVSLAVVALLLIGIHLACTRVGIAIRSAKTYRLAGFWALLCLMGYLSTTTGYRAWTIACNSWPILSSTSTIPLPLSTALSNYHSGGHNRWRQQNVMSLNFTCRTDPGSGFWGEVVGSAAGNFLRDPNSTSHTFSQYQQAIYPFSNSVLYGAPAVYLCLSNARFVDVNIRSNYIYNSATLPASTNYTILWPEILWALTGWALSLWFTIELFLTVRQARRGINRLA